MSDTARTEIRGTGYAQFADVVTNIKGREVSARGPIICWQCGRRSGTFRVRAVRPPKQKEWTVEARCEECFTRDAA